MTVSYLGTASDVGINGDVTSGDTYGVPVSAFEAPKVGDYFLIFLFAYPPMTLPTPPPGVTQLWYSGGGRQRGRRLVVQRYSDGNLHTSGLDLSNGCQRHGGHICADPGLPVPV